MTLEEVRRLLEAAPIERRMLYEVAFSTGLRANELRNLTVDHLDVERCGLWLDAHWTKNRKPGFQPLPADLVRRLAEFVQSGVVGRKYHRFYVRRDVQDPPRNRLLYILSNPVKAFDEDLAAAGIAKVTAEGKLDFHACRVAYTTFVLESGASVKEAQELLRHSTPTLTMNVYARVRQGRLSEVVESLGQLFSRPEGQTQAAPLKAKGVLAAESSGQAVASGGQTAAPSAPPVGEMNHADDCKQRGWMVEGTILGQNFSMRIGRVKKEVKSIL